MANDRKAALDAAMKKIEKNYGKGSIMKLGEKVDQQISTIPSGSLALDVALGVGGSSKYMVQKVLVKQRLHCMRLQKFKNMAGRQPLLMPSTRWTLNTHNV